MHFAVLFNNLSLQVDVDVGVPYTCYAAFYDTSSLPRSGVACVDKVITDHLPPAHLFVNGRAAPAFVLLATAGSHLLSRSGFES